MLNDMLDLRTIDAGRRPGGIDLINPGGARREAEAGPPGGPCAFQLALPATNFWGRPRRVALQGGVVKPRIRVVAIVQPAGSALDDEAGWYVADQ